ncbi:TetR/AcrR family transcriptional regulator [Candidatus Hodarchaeum mangrovi]
MKKNQEQDLKKQLRTKRRKNIRRNHIIDTAEWLFINQGYDQTMVNQIAEKAGYTKASIYNYFDSKDDVYLAVITRAFDAMYTIFQETFSNPNAKFELMTLGKAYLTFVDQHLGYASLMESGRLSLIIGAILYKEENEIALNDREKAFRTVHLNIEKFMLQVISKTMEDAGVHENLDPFSVVMALSTLGTAINDLIRRTATEDPSQNKAREYLEVLFNIIDKGLKHYDD